MSKAAADSILRFVKDTDISGMDPDEIYASWNFSSDYHPSTPKEYKESVSMIRNLKNAKAALPAGLFSECIDAVLA